MTDYPVWHPARRVPLTRLFGLAWRESRAARRRLLLYMSAISLGVAALVAIDSFAGNVTRSVQEQSKALLGGDLAISSRATFAPAVDSILDSLSRSGTPVARIATFASMAVRPATGTTRLAQVRAVSDAYPFYGVVTTQPAGRWRDLARGAHAIVDPSLLVALDASIGDTITLGYGRFEIIATLIDVPGDPGVTAAIGPRIFIPSRYLAETQLLGFGSRAEYEALLKLRDDQAPARFIAPLRPALEKNRVRIRTVAETERNLTEATERLSDFLGIVGLIALLLGGIGVASGVHAFVLRKVDTVAVLRCLGATSGQVLAIYVTQAALMGLAGAAIGAALGVLVQFALPHVIGDFVPVDIVPRLEPRALLAGLAVGVWVSFVFALRPLVRLRHVSPLQTIRRDADATALKAVRFDPIALIVSLALVVSVVVIALLRAPERKQAVAMSAGIGVALLALWGSAVLLSWAARRLLRARWPYVLRQGVANLYRPANQTRAVVLSLGFGAFLVTTLYLVQSNLLRQFTVSAEAASANLVFFDIQEDQAPGVDSIVRAGGHPVLQRVPIVTMRIGAVNGTATTQLLSGARGDRPVWPLRREYRSTYRDTIVASEKMIGGKWFSARAAGDTLYEVSLEREIAQDLGVKVGDVITWDVQGAPVSTRVTSLREVVWARFEPNFFAVFGPGALERAPKQFVVLADIPNETAVAQLQRAVVARYPNVASIDLSLVQRTVADINAKVSVAIRFLAVFSLLMGIPVLFSAVAATRRERLREGVLLKTLGATRAQIGRILLAEYALLGLLGALTGMVLALVGGWALTRFVFENDYQVAWLPSFIIATAMIGLTVGIGLLTGREVFRGTPMAALREA